MVGTCASSARPDNTTLGGAEFVSPSGAGLSDCRRVCSPKLNTAALLRAPQERFAVKTIPHILRPRSPSFTTRRPPASCTSPLDRARWCSRSPSRTSAGTRPWSTTGRCFTRPPIRSASRPRWPRSPPDACVASWATPRRWPPARWTRRCPLWANFCDDVADRLNDDEPLAEALDDAWVLRRWTRRRPGRRAGSPHGERRRRAVCRPEPAMTRRSSRRRAPARPRPTPSAESQEQHPPTRGDTMIALATLNTTLERALAVARQPDKGRDARLTAHKRTRFAALTPDDFADVSHARVLDTYRFISAHVALPCPMHGTSLSRRTGRAGDRRSGDRDAEAGALVSGRRRHRRRRPGRLQLPGCA
jgi:hypothetical protein